jgi:hypothetical protein
MVYDSSLREWTVQHLLRCNHLKHTSIHRCKHIILCGSFRLLLRHCQYGCPFVVGAVAFSIERDTFDADRGTSPMDRSKFDMGLGWRKSGVGGPPAAQVPCTAEPSSGLFGWLSSSSDSPIPHFCSAHDLRFALGVQYGEFLALQPFEMGSRNRSVPQTE